MAATITSSGLGDPLAYLRRQLPDGRRVADVSGPELSRALVAAGVTGAAATNGHDTNARAYDAFMAGIEQQGAARAVAEWLLGARRPC